MKEISWSLIFLVSTILFSCSGNKNDQPPVIPIVDSGRKPTVEATYNPYNMVDVSPMDMTYFPVDYPKLKMSKATTDPPLARIVYSRPHLQGRQLFEEVLKYNEPWRLGANESTELQLFKKASIQDKEINAGRYILYCIPSKDKWTIVFNSNTDSWGLEQDPLKDVIRFDIPISTTTNHIEYFTMLFEGKGMEAYLLMKWDGVEARLPFRF